MKYLRLAYYSPEAFEKLSAAEKEEVGRECHPFDEPLWQSGHVLVVASLQERKAVTLRPRNGKTTVIDGPFTETKEVVGALFIIEATDLDEATGIASRHAAANVGERVGMGVEVLPIESSEQRGVLQPTQFRCSVTKVPTRRSPEARAASLDRRLPGPEIAVDATSPNPVAVSRAAMRDRA